MPRKNEPLGYKTGVKRAVVTTLRELFPRSFVAANELPRPVNINIEYPMQEGEYPCMYVEFEETKLKRAGIGHVEHDYDSQQGSVITARRWIFEGKVTVGFLAMKSKERDLMSDAFLKVVGFTDDFKNALSENPYIGLVINTDEVNPVGTSASPGTPWGSDEVTYYTAYQMDMFGEFFTDERTSGIIERVNIHPRLEGEPDLPDETEGTWQ